MRTAVGRRAASAAAVLVAVLAVAWRLGGLGGDAAADVARPVLLVSGRDDHGELASPTVDLLDAPEGSAVGAVPDGALVRVLAEDATWIHVRTLEEDAPLDGWVDDFHLRGTAHLVADAPACPVPVYGEDGVRVLAVLPPSTQVEPQDVHVIEGRSWVVVRPVAGGDLALAPRAEVHELAGPAPRPGVDCADVRADPAARPHHH